MATKKTPVAKSASKRARIRHPVKKAPTRKAALGAAAPTARVAADDPLSGQRVLFLASVFSRAQLAEWIGVSPSQTSRWASGEERPGPVAAPALIDLEHVYSRARLVWGGESARIWLESANAFLGGARPLDVLLTDGPARVLEALDAEMWGGAA
jgi:Antitoxin Xre/MbcA/ParS C-terminal toxin-binding domain